MTWAQHPLELISDVLVDYGVQALTTSHIATPTRLHDLLTAAPPADPAQLMSWADDIDSLAVAVGGRG
jgi:hypothetical protein